MNDMDSAHVRDVVVSNVSSIAAQIEGAIERLGSFAVAYRLIPFLDCNQWCVLLGGDIQSGIAGFGDSPALAIEAFDRAMYAKATAVKPAVKDSLTTGAQARIPFSLPDAAIDRIYDNARRMFRRHIGSVRGQQVTQADSHEYHIINATLDELRATVDNYQPSAPADDVVRDAERYRFLRDADKSDSVLPYSELLCYAGDSLDDAIDAALAASAQSSKREENKL